MGVQSTFVFLLAVSTLILTSYFIGYDRLGRHAPFKIYIILSVDWEGETLKDVNLQALKDFNQAYPQYPVIHFINPAYYTKKDSLAESAITQKMSSVIKDNDEIGLHIHPWENLVRASGVTPRIGPSFWGETSVGRGGEKGDDIPLNHYSSDEIDRIIAHSIKILHQQGFKQIHSFRGGGWMSGPRVFQALVQNKISIDSSAVPPDLINNLYPNTHLAQFVKEDWQHIQWHSTPHKIDSHPTLTQFPNNGGLADYVDENDFFDLYLNLVNKAKAQGRDWLYIHYGWHQESAMEYNSLPTKTAPSAPVTSAYIHRVHQALEKIERHAKSNDYQIVPVGFKDFPSQYIQPNKVNNI
jgi:hypothetical protein